MVAYPPIPQGFDPTELVVTTLGLSEEQAAALRPGSRTLVVVSAGAGTGKTTTMSARYALNVLRELVRVEGATAFRAVESVAAVTFTELAAAELKSRIAGALERVAAALEQVPELKGLGAGARDAASILPDAPISTIHGLCARLLRRPELAAAAGVAPDFVVLDELESRVLWDRAVEEALDGLARTDPQRVSRVLRHKDGAQRMGSLVRGLAEQVPGPVLVAAAQRSRHRFEQDALAAAVELLHRLAADATIGEAVAEAQRRSVALSRVAGRGFEAALEVLARWCSRTGSAALATVRLGAVGATEKRLARLDPSDGDALEAFSAALQRFKRAADRVVAGLEADALDAEHRWTVDVVTLALSVRERYQALKARRHALDFSDLERCALRGLEQQRRAVPASERPFRTILVDELQDTSRVQRGLLEALLGEALTGLFGVGDPKQSIYRFRHADVSVFQTLFERAGANGLALTVNRRSSPEVLSFVNALFAEVFPAEADPRRPHLAPAQALAPHRSAPPDMGTWPALVVVPVDVTPPEGQKTLRAATLRERDAGACGGVSAALLSSETPVSVLLRAVRGGHRAYVDALDGLGVATELAASGTFTREGATALGIALARALAVPGHDAAWVAVLRSPLVRLPERDVQHLCRWATVNGQPVVEAVRWLLAAEPLLLGACGAAMERLLGALGDGQELHKRIRYLFEAAQVRSRQLDKLLAMVSGLEREGRGPAEVAEVLEQLVADDRSKRVADPRPAGEAATRSLQALTVHASKGLEFPTVVTPQLFSASAGGAFVTPDAAWVNGGWRIGVAVPRGKPSVLRDANRALELEREEAERARLLYVAMTRARDRLVLLLPDGAPEALEPVDTVVTRAIRRLVGAGRAHAGTEAVVSLDGRRVSVRWLSDVAAPVALDAEPETPPRSLTRPPTPLVAFDGPPVWPVTHLARLAYCPAYYAQYALAPSGPPLEAPLPRGGAVRGQERGIEVHDLLARLTDEASLDAVETAGDVPSRLLSEWPSLSTKLRTVMRRDDLAPLFTRDGLWREFALEGRVEGVTLTGALDRLAVAGAGAGAVRAVIGEFKTGGRGFGGAGGHEPAYGIAYRFQLAAYVAMLHGWLGPRLVEPVVTHLVFVDLNQVVTEAWSVAQALAEVRRVVGEIHHPYSLPLHRAACSECPLSASCAAR